MTGQPTDNDIQKNATTAYAHEDDILQGISRLNEDNVIEYQGNNDVYNSPTLAKNNNKNEINNGSQRELWTSHKQANITQSTSDSISIPCPTNIPMSIDIDKQANDTRKLHSYDDLAIPRLIRRQE